MNLLRELRKLRRDRNLTTHERIDRLIEILIQASEEGIHGEENAEDRTDGDGQ